MAEPKRTEFQKLEDKKRLLNLMTQGIKTHTEMTDIINKRYKDDGVEISLSRQQISYDIYQIYEELENDIQKEAPKVMALQARRYLILANEAYQGWLKSQRKSNKDTVIDKDGEYGFHQTVNVKEDRTGDPRFLLVMERCLDKVNRMYGLYVKPSEGELPNTGSSDESENVELEIPDNGR